jgi:hypothetical protein
MCPVAALRVLRSVTTGGGATDEGPVFVGRAGHPVGLAKTTVAVRLRKALQAVGVQEWELYVCCAFAPQGWRHFSGRFVRGSRGGVSRSWAGGSQDVVREYLYSSVTSMWDATAQLQRG